jgi:hypothetical protein
LEKEFIAGANGDEAALTRAMQTADKILAAKSERCPNARLARRGRSAASRKSVCSGNFSEGGELWQAALKNMKSAVEIEPNSVSIRTTRAAALFKRRKTLSLALTLPKICAKQPLRITKKF